VGKKNTKIQKYKNTKIQKYKNTKIQKYKKNTTQNTNLRFPWHEKRDCTMCHNYRVWLV
jgi:hypothetical protein